jgi:hypothetical protein
MPDQIACAAHRVRKLPEPERERLPGAGWQAVDHAQASGGKAAEAGMPGVIAAQSDRDVIKR